MLSIAIFGSSDDDLTSQYEDLIEEIVTSILSVSNDLRIITGGYGGTMEMVSRLFKEKKNISSHRIITCGILFKGYDEKPNQYLDETFTADSLGDRLEYYLDIADVFIALPGRSGTLHEILHIIENMKFSTFMHKRLLVHSFWQDKLLDFFHKGFLSFFSQESFSQIFIKEIPQRAISKNKVNNIKTNGVDFIKNVNTLIGDFENKNHVLALDTAIFFIDPDLNERSRVTSQCVKEYETILKLFLSSNPSLVGFGKDIAIFSELNNIIRT